MSQVSFLQSCPELLNEKLSLFPDRPVIRSGVQVWHGTGGIVGFELSNHCLTPHQTGHVTHFPPLGRSHGHIQSHVTIIYMQRQPRIKGKFTGYNRITAIVLC